MSCSGFAPYLIADMLRGGRALAAWWLTPADPGNRGRRWARACACGCCASTGLGQLVPPALKRRRPGGVGPRRDRCSCPPTPRRSCELADDGPRSRELDGPLWWRGLAGDLTRPARRSACRPAPPRGDRRADRPTPSVPVRPRAAAHGARQPPELQFDPIRDRALLRDALVGTHPGGGAHPSRQELLHRPAAPPGSPRMGPCSPTAPLAATRRCARSCAPSRWSCYCEKAQSSRQPSRTPAVAGRPGRRVAAGARARGVSAGAARAGRASGVGASPPAVLFWSLYFFRSCDSYGRSYHFPQSSSAYERNPMEKDMFEYETPRIEDHGSLEELTAGQKEGDRPTKNSPSTRPKKTSPSRRRRFRRRRIRLVTCRSPSRRPACDV